MSGTEAKVFVDDETTASITVDLSSLVGTSWYIRLSALGTRVSGDKACTTNASIEMKGIGRVVHGASAATVQYHSNTQSLDHAGTGGIAYTELVDNENELKIALSADGGSNFGNDMVGRYAVSSDLTSGSSGVIRIKGDTPTAIDYPNSSLMVLDTWAFQIL